MEIRNQIKNIITEIFKQNGFIDHNINIEKDNFTLDSILFISIIVELERNFNITIPEDKIDLDDLFSLERFEKLVESVINESSNPLN